MLDGALCVQNASRSFFETFKIDRYETIGRPLYELGNGQWDIPALRQLLVEVIPKATAVIDYQVEHDFPDLGRKIMLVTARKLHHPDSASHSMLVSIVDVTERHRRDVAKELMFSELRHRMKNLLAVAEAIARQTTTKGRSAEEYRDDFLGRFSALVESQDLAFSQLEEASLGALIQRNLEPYTAHAEALVIEPGADIQLSARALMSLSLVTGGRVSIAWQVEEGNSQLRLKWAESGGPRVTPPIATGYGTRLIQSTTAYSLGGQVEQQYAADGLK